MNLKKLKPNFTIKRMLMSLVLTGVLVMVALSVTTLYSNGKLIDSQKWLTGIVMPLDNANQEVNIALMAFTIRKYSITEAKTLKELNQFEERKNLEQGFTESIQHLKTFAQKAKESDATRNIQELEKLYGEMLKKDSALLESVKNCLGLEADIKSQMTVLDAAAAELRKNAEAISEKIGQILREYVSAAGQKGAPTGSGIETYLGDLSQAQKVSLDLRLAISFLTDYARQLLLAGDLNQITAIKTDKIVLAVEIVERSVEILKTSKIGNLTEFISKIETDFKLLKSAILEGERSIVILRNRWLAEQKTIADLNSELLKITSSLSETLKAVQILANRVRTQAEDEAQKVSMTGKIILTVAGCAILLMVFMGALLIRRIINPINKVVSFADTISRGDLTAEILPEHDDEIGKLVFKLSEMAHSLNSLIGQVQRSGIQVTSSATELSATSKQQEAVMKTQLESTNDVVKSVEEISNVSAELVETMKRVAAMSEQTAEFANKGQSDLAQMEEAMRHMENASKSISAKLEAINEKAANITSVVTTITKVADQTNLLSLNAAIEAEKAGEYGRGFTVVAREIRRLADQTAVATLDIDQMVQEMQSAVSAGVMEMDAFIAEVQKSAENVGKISIQLTKIIQQVQALSPSFEEVNESMQIQSGNAQQINASMAHLSEEMQQTMESLRESFLAIEQLNDAARGLQDEVSRFRVM